MKHKKRSIIIIGFLFSVIIILVIIPNINFNQLIDTLKTINPSWILVAAFFIILGVLVRSKRWKIIAVKGEDKLFPFIEANVIGYSGNLLLPARIGEVLRIVSIREFGGLNLGKAISSGLFDRICDGLAISFFLGFVLLYSSELVNIPVGIHAMSFFFIGGAFLILLFIVYGEAYLPFLLRITAHLPDSIHSRISTLLYQALNASLELKEPKIFLKVYILSILIGLIDSGVYLSIFLGFGWDLPLISSVVLMIFIAMVSVFPSSPGYFGLYQMACIFALDQFGIDETGAIACSIIIHLLLYGIFLPSLIILSIQRGVSIINMWKQTI